ncbi:Hypothetical predicted protein [Paramuricea clavata]|uniref:Uncharacterized protein n=1 Tax=Paramuricea clavata TaxID=317549 RepID=A0A7D9JEE1_PARCT|nr:Hypothetical predicted protein [Paramuricea clavata]
MVEGAADAPDRSQWLVNLGRVTLLLLYVLQVCLFVSFLVTHLDHYAYIAWFVLFIPAFVSFWYFLKGAKVYADNDKDIRGVWITWGLYIVAYVATVAMIFATFAHDLTKGDILGINALVGTLCITPVLLILLLQLTISPSYQKTVLLSTIFAALNLFDGIKMLEIFLAQNEADFDLNMATEISILVFACICFILSPFGFVRNKFMADGVVKARRETSAGLVQLEIIGINLPFLVLRAIIWRKYEAAIFMVKNIVALAFGVIEFLVLKEILICGGNPPRA